MLNLHAVDGNCSLISMSSQEQTFHPAGMSKFKSGVLVMQRFSAYKNCYMKLHFLMHLDRPPSYFINNSITSGPVIITSACDFSAGSLQHFVKLYVNVYFIRTLTEITWGAYCCFLFVFTIKSGICGGTYLNNFLNSKQVDFSLNYRLSGVFYSPVICPFNIYCLFCTF